MDRKADNRSIKNQETTENSENQKLEYLNPSSPKAVALYEAVSALSREGADLTQLKVSDIAAKAGIGKGTVYDYFKSREELIVKAVLYTIFKHLRIVKSRVCQADGFRKKVDVMLDTLFEAEDSDTNIFQILMPFIHDIGNFPGRFREEFIKCAPSISEIENLFQTILISAEEEGIVMSGLNLYFVENAFINTVMDYARYKKTAKCGKLYSDLSEEKVRQRLYENLVYMLR